MWVHTGGAVLCLLLAVCSGNTTNHSKSPIYSEKMPIVSYGIRVRFRTTYPWHAGLYKKTTNPYMQICGGTIVARNVVITAAHCISQDRHMPPASDFAVAAGKIYRPWNDSHDNGAQKSDVIEIKVPPRYQGAQANYQEDIAVLILSKQFKFHLFVKPACVNFDAEFENAQLKEGQFGKIAGWGLTDENSGASQVLQAASLPTVAIDKCIEQSPAGFRSSITGDKICAGYNNGTAVCRGDSGGGLVYSANLQLLELAFLRGVASTSPTSQNDCNIHTWATFTHVLKHQQFLKDAVPDIERSCELPPNHDPTEPHFAGIDNSHQCLFVNCCACKCVKPYQVQYQGQMFNLNL